jgi:hypothetical protein
LTHAHQTSHPGANRGHHDTNIDPAEHPAQPTGPPGHDPVMAEIRNQVIDRMHKMNFMHAMHAWERRRSTPIGPHGLAFLYWDVPGGGGRPQHLVVDAATRLVHDEEEVRDLKRLLYRLYKLAVDRYLPDGGFDPRTTMANRTGQMSAEARFIGLGVSSLDTMHGTWADVRDHAGGPMQIPGRCFAMLFDGTRMVLDRDDDRNFGYVRIRSTRDLNVKPGDPSRLWTPEREIREPEEVWWWLGKLGGAVAEGEHLRGPRLPRQRHGR